MKGLFWRFGAAWALVGVSVFPGTAGCEKAPKPAAVPSPSNADGARERVRSVLLEARQAGRFSEQHVATLWAVLEDHDGSAAASRALHQALLSREDWDGLVRLYGRTPPEKRSPQDVTRLANFLIQAQRFKAAASMLVPRFESGEADSDQCWLAAYACFQAGDDATAARVLDGAQAQLLADGRWDALFLRGLIHFHSGEHERARDLLDRFLLEWPDHIPANNAKGRLLAALGQTEEARRFLDRARALHQALNAQEAADERARALGNALDEAWRAGRYDRCEFLIAEMLPSADSAAAERLRHLWVGVLEAQGRTEEANQVRRSTATGPTDPAGAEAVDDGNRQVEPPQP